MTWVSCIESTFSLKDWAISSEEMQCRVNEQAYIRPFVPDGSSRMIPASLNPDSRTSSGCVWFSEVEVRPGIEFEIMSPILSASSERELEPSRLLEHAIASSPSMPC